ncbi:MAG: slipin family protein [Chitinispirillaceae bacterium]|nr:slipin family protein [Chitinispirillaceae bacterium]
MEKPVQEYKEKKEYSSFLWEFRKKMFSCRRYALNVILILAGLVLVFGSRHIDLLPQTAVISIAAFLLLLGMMFRIAFEWERVPILRFGRLRKTSGPGMFFLLPVIDIPYDYVDCRITVTDFTAEKVLTRDAVPVYVDALIFWLIWDAAKAKLEVENYRIAVPLSAKTALRDIIGKTTLAQLLTDRDTIGQELLKILDAKTNPWGITSLSVEIKDIVVPKELEDSISKEAQAEREKNARIILGSAELDLAQKYAEASKLYKGNEEAMMLRSLNMLLDAVNNKGSMILVPSEIPHVMNKAVAAALAKRNGGEIVSGDTSGM